MRANALPINQNLRDQAVIEMPNGTKLFVPVSSIEKHLRELCTSTETQGAGTGETSPPTPAGTQTRRFTGKRGGRRAKAAGTATAAAAGAGS